MYTLGMGTTTIRVDTRTHARLLDMSREAGMSLGATVQDAVEALWRQRFAHHSMTQLSELHKDPEAWKAYLAEAEETHVDDGVS